MGTREDILDAAERILRSDGFAHATTKRIAKQAGYSEAALYKHFADKSEIFLGVLSERLPGSSEVVGELGEQAGQHTVWANLTRLARSALDFYIASFPIAVSVFATRELLAQHRERLDELDAGPQHAVAGVARYLRAERAHGRLDRRCDPDSAASLLLGACFQQAFLINFSGERPDGSRLDTLAAGLARTVLDGIGH